MKKNLTCIDLFSGCGGLSLGLEEAGFTPLLFSELSPHAAETYIANRQNKEIIPIGDIYNLTDLNLNLIKTYWQDYEYHVFENRVVVKNPDQVMFSGTFNEFKEFCLED